MDIIAYASISGTKVNNQRINDAGWRWLLNPYDARPGYQHYAMDCGAWIAHNRGTTLDEALFEKFVARYHQNADWIVLPDIVAGGQASLALSLSWIGRLPASSKLLLAAQNGMTFDDVSQHLNERIGIFLGGDTDYKLSTGHAWGEIARQRHCYFHVGRVNSARRIMWCSEIGADSFDGTSATVYSQTLPRLERARQQPSIFRDARGQ